MKNRKIVYGNSGLNTKENTERNITSKAQKKMSHRKKKVGRKKKRRDRACAYRTIDKLKKKLSTETRQYETLKKAAYRSKKKEEKKNTLSDSPKSKVRSMIAEADGKITFNIERKLLVGEVFLKQLQEKNSVKSIAEKRKVSNMLVTPLLKKYKLGKEVKNIISSKKIRKGVLSESLKKKMCLSMKEGSNVRKFLEEDENSKMCPGKKDVKQKVQKRYLAAPLKRLHQKFCVQNSSKMCFTTFKRLKPDWIIKPKLSNRDTCACEKCDNFQILVETLHKLGLISTKNSCDILEKICCKPVLESCVYRTCNKCQSQEAITINEAILNDSVSYDQFVKVSEKKVIKGEEKVVKSTKRKVCKGIVSDLIGEYNKQVSLFLKHEFCKKHQFKALKSIRDNLQSNETLIRVDFSENYVCKLNREVQAMHFGASKLQLSLHTGVQYIKEEKLQAKSFTTISENLEHAAPGIWAHLNPVLKKIAQNENINTLRIGSDGPTGQYKNRFNLHLLTKLLPKFCPNIKRCTWNFTEAGHGKGPMDGVGGTLKRAADELVSHGTDINSGEKFVSEMKVACPKISLTEILDENFNEIEPFCDSNITAIPQITKMHQAAWDSTTPDTIYLRKFSCLTCQKICEHYGLGNGFVKFTKSVPKKSKNLKKLSVSNGKKKETLSQPKKSTRSQKKKK